MYHFLSFIGYTHTYIYISYSFHFHFSNTMQWLCPFDTLTVEPQDELITLPENDRARENRPCPWRKWHFSVLCPSPSLPHSDIAFRAIITYFLFPFFSHGVLLLLLSLYPSTHLAESAVTGWNWIKDRWLEHPTLPVSTWPLHSAGSAVGDTFPSQSQTSFCNLTVPARSVILTFQVHAIFICSVGGCASNSGGESLTLRITAKMKE